MDIRVSLSVSKAAGDVKLTTHLPLYFHSWNTPSWHAAQLKHRDNFTF